MQKSIIYVNKEVTTHIVMPEPIKMMDVSTQKIVGNQCADNMVRIKPASQLLPLEQAGTITLIGERHMVQYDIVYSATANMANSLYYVNSWELQGYTHPDVSLTSRDMARLSWNIFTSKKKNFHITSRKYGMVGRVNNIYTLDDYFFIDFSLTNKTKIKYDIAEIRLKLMDKKQSKATNSQTIELTPVYTLSKNSSFHKGYRNVIVVKKLTFPNEKRLLLEISEDQISGRVITIPIDYSDVLNADSFHPSLLGR